jgi:hypothetical protein
MHRRGYWLTCVPMNWWPWASRSGSRGTAWKAKCQMKGLGIPSPRGQAGDDHVDDHDACGVLLAANVRVASMSPNTKRSSPTALPPTSGCGRSFRHMTQPSVRPLPCLLLPRLSGCCYLFVNRGHDGAWLADLAAGRLRPWLARALHPMWYYHQRGYGVLPMAKRADVRTLVACVRTSPPAPGAGALLIAGRQCSGGWRS